MEDLQTLVKSFIEAKSSPGAVIDLQNWLNKGGLESLKPGLMQYLHELETFSLEVIYEGKVTLYTVSVKNTITDICRAISFREGIETSDLLIHHENGSLLSSDQLVDSLQRIHVTQRNSILQFQTGGIHPITYDVNVTPTTTVGYVRDHLAAVTGIPVNEQRLMAGMLQLQDDMLIYPTWVTVGSPSVLRITKIEHIYTIHNGDKRVTLNAPYDCHIQNIIAALGPKVGVSSARIALETKQGRLSPETLISAANEQGDINIVVLPVPVVGGTGTQSYHPLGKTPVIWIPISSEMGYTMNIGIDVVTPLSDIKDIVRRQTSIPVARQVYTMGIGVILQDNWLLYPTWMTAKSPPITVSMSI